MNETPLEKIQEIQDTYPETTTSDAIRMWANDNLPGQLDALTRRMAHKTARLMLSIGPGWWPLVLELDLVLARLDPDYEITQVKEKFGTLRFYAHSPLVSTPDTNDYLGDIKRAAFQALINAAERESGRICEECGEEGFLSGSGWIRTLCETHHKTRPVPMIPQPPSYDLEGDADFGEYLHALGTDTHWDVRATVEAHLAREYHDLLETFFRYETFDISGDSTWWTDNAGRERYVKRIHWCRQLLTRLRED